MFYALRNEAQPGGLKKNAQQLRQEFWAWPISQALIDNTIDMQSVTRSSEKSATGAQIPHKTTGPAARSDGGASVGGPTGAPEGGALGTNAKLRATFHDPMESRVQRFALQSVARSILPESRTAKCLRIRAHDCDVPGLEIQGARHGQLRRSAETCGSVWTCPVCAAKIAERRRVELLDAMELHKAQGGAVFLLTLTTPHQRGDVLAELLDQQGKALQSFLRDRKVKEVFKEVGHVGQVRAWSPPTVVKQPGTTAGIPISTSSSSVTKKVTKQTERTGRL